jgi:xanthine dehydrogenase accessory factor
MIDSGVVNATQDVAIGWLQDDRRFVQALLVDVEGSAPLPIGAMLVVDEDGIIEGSITGGCVEGAVVQEAEAILRAGHGAKVLTYGISDELAGTVGLTCGGIVHIFVDQLASGARGRTRGGDRDVAWRPDRRRSARGDRRQGHRIPGRRGAA